MLRKKFFLYIIPIMLVIPLLFLICLKKTGPLEGEVTFLTGTLTINSAPGYVGSRVIKNDTLITGEKSLAVIQLSDSAVITLKSDTEMVFEDLSDGKSSSRSASLLLNRGESVHKVMKMGSGYSVKSPTAVASVRGTEFEMSSDEQRTMIRVESGTVYVKKISRDTRADRDINERQNEGAEEIILREGDTLVIYTLGAGAHGYVSGTAVKDTASVGKAADKSGKRAEGIKKSTAGKDSSAADRGKSGTAVKKSTEARKTAAAGSKKTSGRKAESESQRKAQSEEGRFSTAEDEAVVRAGGSSSDKTSAGKKADDKAGADLKPKDDTASGIGGGTSGGRKSGTGADTARGSKTASDITGGEKTPDPDAVRTLINNKDRSLSDIKKVYSRIDRIYLYSGKIITGAIIERGAVYSIITTDGIEKVSKKDIQSNEIVK